MTLQRLKWVAIVGPLLFLGLLDTGRHVIYPELLHDWWGGNLLVAGAVLLAVLLFAETVFAFIGGMQDRNTRQTRELLALHQAGLSIAAELSLQGVLQKVVDEARALAGARYGALAVVDASGAFVEFITSGLSAEERKRLGALPRGTGLLALPLQEGRAVRIASIPHDPRRVGFPPGHPAMTSYLGVPIVWKDRAIGTLYLTDNEQGGEFDQGDEETLIRFATQAAIAIENARLHQQVQDLAVVEERERIAREMHDSPAQLLAYVNAKAEAARQLLQAGRWEQAAAELEELARGARAAYADVREAILGLRTTPAGRSFLEALRDYLERYRVQADLEVELDVEPADGNLDEHLGLEPSKELQLLRILQEALSNVRRHAGVDRARLSIRCEGDEVVAQVEDAGRGFDIASSARHRGPHFGLATMRERAEGVDGRLEVRSQPGGGTVVTVRLPRSGGGNAERTSETDAHPPGR